MNTKAVKYLSAISLNERIKFLKLLLRWKGSLWKLLWADFLWFLAFYLLVTLLYQFYLINDEIHKKRFEALVTYMNKVAALVPLSFLLGFFVSTVLGRWWTIINSIPWMTKPSYASQAFITEGDKDKCKQVRLTLMRYMNIAWIFALISLSKKVRDRFHISSPSKGIHILKKDQLIKPPPIRERMNKLNDDEVVRKHFGKLIMEEEMAVFETFEKEAKKPTYLIPLMWCTKLVQRSLKAGYIKSDSGLMSMIQTFQSGLEGLHIYNEFNVPLVYTQVIVIVVYAFLISEILSQQIVSIEKTGNLGSSQSLETYLPIFAIFKFLIYMGWFKVGLCFINPFGGDQTDLPLDEILNYNLEVSTTIGAGHDSYFPGYLSDSFDESTKDRFDIFDDFKIHLPTGTNSSEQCFPNKQYLEMKEMTQTNIP